MDIFDRPCYRLNKLYLSVSGQWPYDNATKRHVILIVITVVTFTQIAAKICSIFTTYNDTDLLFDSLPPVIGNIVIVVKILTYYMKIDELKSLLNHIKVDWGMVKTEEEIEVLQSYAERGRRFSKLYARVLLMTMATFVITPVAPRLLLRMGNMSAPRPLPHNVNYFVDSQEYYYPILFHTYIAIAMLMICLVAADAMFIVFVQHACGIFSIIEYKLEHVVEDEGSENFHLPMKDDACYYNVRECIQWHISVLRYCKALEHFYTKAFFVQAGLNMIIMSITAVRATSALGSPQLVFRMLIYSLAQITHLVVECYQGQELIDHSLRIQKGLMSSLWYLTSLRTRRLIQFMISASQVPCMLTAGKLFVISMEFCSVVRSHYVSHYALHIDIVYVKDVIEMPKSVYFS